MNQKTLKLLIISVFVATLTTTFYINESSSNETSIDNEQLMETKDNAKNAANELLRKTGAALKALIGEDKDFMSAVDGCRKVAYSVIDDINGRPGYNIKRVSLKPRNPSNTPDEFEEKVLREFEEKNRRGELGKGSEYYVSNNYDGKRTLRYLRPLKIKKVCLNCHGKTKDLAPGINDFLKANYPNDKATGYSLGEVRGAVSVTVEY